MEWIANHETQALKKTYTMAKPFRHVLIENFLRQEMVGKLTLAIKEQTFTELNADLYQFAQTKDLSVCKNTDLEFFCMEFCSPEVRQVVSKITGKKLKEQIDLSGFRYKQTDYLLPHDDLVAEKETTRRVAFVLYLTTLAKSEGGTLQLFDQKGMIKQSITPTANTLVLFEVSKSSFHQVEEVYTKRERMSIAGWFHG